MANEKRYNKGMLMRMDSKVAGKAYGFLELWPTQAATEVTTVAGDKKVLHIKNLNGRFGKSVNIGWTLGDEVAAQMKEETLWVSDITCWNGLAENVAKLDIQKGKRIFVYGMFETKTYDRKNGDKGISVECVADRIEVVYDGNSYKEPNGYLRRVGNEPGNAIGALALYLSKPMTVGETTTQKPVGTIDSMYCKGYANTNIPYALGEDIPNAENQTVWVRGDAYDKVLERLQKLNLQKGARVLVSGNFEVQTFTRKDDTVGKQVVCRSIRNFEVLNFGNKNETSASAETPVAPAQPVAPADNGGFQPLDGADDFQLPF